jgi:hypothetical protein
MPRAKAASGSASACQRRSPAGDIQPPARCIARSHAPHPRPTRRPASRAGNQAPCLGSSCLHWCFCAALLPCSCTRSCIGSHVSAARRQQGSSRRQGTLQARGPRRPTWGAWCWWAACTSRHRRTSKPRVSLVASVAARHTGSLLSMASTPCNNQGCPHRRVRGPASRCWSA